MWRSYDLNNKHYVIVNGILLEYGKQAQVVHMPNFLGTVLTQPDVVAEQNTNSLCGSVGKDFVYHACGHEFESRLKWKFSNFPHHLWRLLSDYW